ncbi:MAG: HD-GYP domain-containing protein [Syntrophaceae bacterium]|nr:HD-GYP domain-containing protein [Syntrophaceae bacterium]
MEKILPSNQLQVGMYVLMPVSWTDHPFLKSQFQLTSQNQIGRIIRSGIKEVRVDYDKSRVVNDELELEIAAPAEPKKEIVPDGLRKAIFDKTLPPLAKANQVHEYSREMIKNLMDNPTAENISATKRAIADLVDLILDDIETSHLLMTITDHDYYTYTHSVRVGILSVCLARNVFRRSTAHDLHKLGVGFFLHDLGKVRIDQRIINKPNILTDEEMRVMQKHPNLGYDILRETKQITEESKIIILQHHERYDGTGYPRGIRGNDIHIYARMCAIADVYDALTTDRPYRKKMRPFDGLKIMKEYMMQHFQKDLFEQFVFMIAGRKEFIAKYH